VLLSGSTEVDPGSGERAGLGEVIIGAFVVVGGDDRPVPADDCDKNRQRQRDRSELLLDQEPAHPGDDDQDVVRQDCTLALRPPHLLPMLGQ